MIYKNHLLKSLIQEDIININTMIEHFPAKAKVRTTRCTVIRR